MQSSKHKKLNKNKVFKIVFIILFLTTILSFTNHKLYSYSSNNNSSSNNLNKLATYFNILGAYDRKAGQFKSNNGLTVGEYRPGDPNIIFYGVDINSLTNPGYVVTILKRHENFREDIVDIGYDASRTQREGILSVSIISLTRGKIESLEYGDYISIFKKIPGDTGDNMAGNLTKSFRYFDSNAEELKQLIDEKETIKQGDNYQYAFNELKQNYDRAISEGEQLYQRRERQQAISQSEADAKIRAIKNAKDALNGTKVKALEEAVQRAEQAKQELINKIREVTNGVYSREILANLRAFNLNFENKKQELNNTYNLSEPTLRQRYDNRKNALKKVLLPPELPQTESIYGLLTPDNQTTFTLPIRVNPSVFDVFLVDANTNNKIYENVVTLDQY